MGDAIMMLATTNHLNKMLDEFGAMCLEPTQIEPIWLWAPTAAATAVDTAATLVACNEENMRTN